MKKMVCFYQAKCEIYDRSLTDLRSPYDKTEAFIVGEAKKYSTHYAESLKKRFLNGMEELKLKDRIK
ncbi:hypothetical protein H8S37_04005 [Mediterraneibacter sp. NSJ-55]|uniref:Uncharacterized protein n=1 Tax=Mediterraneibacter hominis TaxID=2763054 RepID=A0A923RR72_9FIRM|nr:hypothetical protein [Mediterraneibacter hominis]MBC5688097.1 hypothetical protein [Mediterraneibacter hominis]